LKQKLINHHVFAGKKALFSEQQMMDCSWGQGLNQACDGGDYDAAMDYLKLAGGPIEEKQYEYLGADGFCRQKNFTSGGLAGFEAGHLYEATLLADLFMQTEVYKICS